MENAVGDILRNWGFEDLIPVFEENKIGQEAFDSLNTELIKELIPQIGPRTLFNKKYELYKAPIFLETPNSSFTDDTGSVVSWRSSPSLQSPTQSELEDDSPPIMAAAFCQIADLGMTETEKENTPYALAQKTHQHKCLKALDLQSLLESSSKGKMILSSYNVNKKLSPSLRDKLTEIIIENEIEKDLNNRITVDRYETLANAIVGLFPTEVKELNFSYSLKRKLNGVFIHMGSGKLFRKFYNSRRTLRTSGLIPKPQKPLLASKISELDDDDDKIIWLKNSIEPWAQVTEMWRGTFEKRNFYRTQNIPIMTYMQTFPALKQNLGYTLLEIDFETLHPECESLFTNVGSFCEKILTYAKTLKSKDVIQYLRTFEEDALSTDIKNIYILLMLPLLLKSSVVKKIKGGGYWKPSKIEVAEGFILHVKIPGDIKPSLERKQNKLATFGLTVQPIPVIVGEDCRNIISSYVAIDDILYEVPTPIKAVDVCFKAIHSLNACYSKEADMVWMLIQKGVYHLNTPYDQKYMSVESILNEL